MHRLSSWVHKLFLYKSFSQIMSISGNSIHCSYILDIKSFIVSITTSELLQRVCNALSQSDLRLQITSCKVNFSFTLEFKYLFWIKRGCNPLYRRLLVFLKLFTNIWLFNKYRWQDGANEFIVCHMTEFPDLRFLDWLNSP